MHACFLLHPGLCPGRGWNRDTERAGGSYPGLSFGTQRKSFSSSHPPNRLPAPERGGLSWPPEREVWKLASGVVRPTGTRHWTAAVGRSRDSGQEHIGTWVQSIMAWLRRCTQVSMSPEDWIKFLDTPPKAQRIGNSQAGEEEQREKLRETPQTSAPLVLGAGDRGEQGCLYLSLRKAEARLCCRRPLGWGRGRTPSSEQAPPPQARTLPVPSPRVWGPQLALFLPNPAVRSG